MAANFHCLETGAASEGADSSSGETALDEDEDEAADPPEPEPEPLTALQQENLEFWTELCHQLDQRGSVIKPGAPHSRTGHGVCHCPSRLSPLCHP